MSISRLKIHGKSAKALVDIKLNFMKISNKKTMKCEILLNKHKSYNTK